MQRLHGRFAPTVVHASGRAVSVRGGVRRRAMARAINAHLPEIHECLARWSVMLDSDREAWLEWTISTGGKVLSARVKSSSLENPELEACILERFKTWSFPKPRSGIARVTYPLRFAVPEAELSAEAR